MSYAEFIWADEKKHMFGGIEPSHMKSFTAASRYDTSTSKPKITIVAKLPDDTVINGQTLCSVKGAIIRKSTTSFPTTEFEGTLVADIAEDSTIYDTDVELGNTYYYSAFPYTAQNVFGRHKKNQISVVASNYSYLYGYDLNTKDHNPATRVTYPSDVDNSAYTPAYMDFTSGKFNFGSWPSTPGEKFMPRSCMLKYNCAVDYYLNEDNNALKEDGSASDIANLSYEGNAMMEWNKIYYHIEEVDGIRKFRCSDSQLSTDWDCISNYDINNQVIPNFYTPKYTGPFSGGKLRSMSGQGNAVGNTAATEISNALANGPDYYIEVLADRLLINNLLIMMCKSTDTQSKYGYGLSNQTSASGTGTCNANGMFFGGAASSNSYLKVFGMENYWGNIWRRTAGWINASGVQEIKMTRGTHDGSTATDYNLDGAGYIAFGQEAKPSGTSGGYISSCLTTRFGALPVEASGSSTLNEADGLWFNNGQTNYAVVGGAWCYAALCGAFDASLNGAASLADSYVGAALSCKPRIS